MNTTKTYTAFNRHKLLVTVSVTALLSAAYGTAEAASDVDRPLLWIEVGGQLNRQSGQDEPFVPPFAQVAEQHGLLPLAPIQTPPEYSLDEEASLSFQPENSDWHIAASIKYGRSGVRKHRYEQLDPVFYHSPNWGLEQYPNKNRRAAGAPGGFESPHVIFGAVPEVDYSADLSERHVILDFQAGKDVGLGMFGHGSTSEIALGVRIAQLNSKSKLKLYADPYPHMDGMKYFPFFHFHVFTNIYDQAYKAAPTLSRSFTGLGPSLSWTGSTTVAGLGGDSSISFDWGSNFGLLFGRQKVRVQHNTTGTRFEEHLFVPSRSPFDPLFVTSQYVRHTRVERSRNVTVPNVGGTAGFSLQFPNAKVSIGYRADFFFGAIDGGIDARKSETRGFYGPFASISIGLGD